MAIRRKLNIPQLFTLCEVYWDDPAKLAEILEDLRSRLEPEAAALFRTVAGRIDLLRRDPEAAKAQLPPTQRAEAAEPVAAGPRPVTARRPSRRRLVPIAVVLVAACVAAWLLWPHTAPKPPPTKTVSGPEVALGGKRPDVTKTPGTGQSSPVVPPAIVQPDRAQRLARPQGAGGGESGEGAAGSAGSAPRLRQPPESHAHEKELAEADEAAAHAAPDDADAAAAAAVEPTAAAAHEVDRSGGGPAAGAGVAIDDATLTCYRTDSNPDSCGAPPAAAAPQAAPSAGPAATIALPPPSSPSPPSAATPVATNGPSAPNAGPSPAAGSGSPSTPPQGAAVAAGSPSSSSGPGGGGGGAGGGGSSSGGSASGSASNGDKASPRDTKKPNPTKPAKAQLAAASAAPPPSCPPTPVRGRVGFILDGSLSMGLPLDVDANVEDRLDDGVRHHDPAARREYRALLAEPGPKRITRARAAFAAAAADLPPKVDLGLVVFQECRDIRSLGVFDAAHRAQAIDAVDKLVPKGRTPIADSLRRAAKLLGKGRSSIVLLTDGREFCGGNPCAAAKEIKAAHPHTPVSIVDITGQAKSECVAQITGGRSYKPEAADDLARVVSAAFRGADPRCGAELEPAREPSTARRR